jgi:O-antigen/teichoic acid export membrane protein
MSIINNKSGKKTISFVVLWQTIGNFSFQGVAFFTVPIFTRLLAVSDYGMVAVYNTWVSLSCLLVGLQTHGSIANARIKYEDDKMNGYLSSIMTISVISFFVFLMISLIFNKVLSNLLALQPDLIVLIIIQSFTSFCIAFYTSKLLQYKQVEKSTIISLVTTVLSTIFAIIFLLFTKKDRYIAKIYGNAIPVITIGFIIGVSVLKNGKTLFRKEYWKYCLALTFPLIIHGAGLLILAQSDRIMLQRLKGLEVAGIYSFVYTIAMVVQLIWVSFNNSWIPFYYEYKKNNQNELILYHSKNYIITYTIILMGFILLAPEVYKLMSPVEYWPGIYLVPMIALVYYINFFYSFPVNFEFFNEKTKLISIGTTIAALINILCNLVLIPVYAGVGAAIATLIAYVFLFFFHEIVARYIIKGYEFKWYLYIMGFISVLISIVLFYFLLEKWIIRWSLGIILGITLLIRIKKNKEIF